MVNQELIPTLDQVMADFKKHFNLSIFKNDWIDRPQGKNTTAKIHNLATFKFTESDVRRWLMSYLQIEQDQLSEFFDEQDKNGFRLKLSAIKSHLEALTKQAPPKQQVSPQAPAVLEQKAVAVPPVEEKKVAPVEPVVKALESISPVLADDNDTIVVELLPGQEKVFLLTVKAAKAPEPPKVVIPKLVDLIPSGYALVKINDWFSTTEDGLKLKKVDPNSL
jgi:hypothetical protein